MKAASIPLCLPTSPEAMSVDIVTFGCRLNAFESEVIAREAENAGLTDTIVIIPYGRGNSRSVPMGGVVDQVRALVERGHAEIVLTGVDLTSYGADLPGTPKLGQLTKQILRHVPELKRLRISSVDQIEVDRDLLEIIADDERLMPHLHLSLQSGDDLILKRMKRRHSRKNAIDFCAHVRRVQAQMLHGADIIASFPTEP